MLKLVADAEQVLLGGGLVPGTTTRCGVKLFEQLEDEEYPGVPSLGISLGLMDQWILILGPIGSWEGASGRSWVTALRAHRC